MDKQFGLHFLLQAHLGIASNVVEPHTREERKSIGAERWVAQPRPRVGVFTDSGRRKHVLVYQ